MFFFWFFQTVYFFFCVLYNVYMLSVFYVRTNENVSIQIAESILILMCFISLFIRLFVFCLLSFYYNKQKNNKGKTKRKRKKKKEIETFIILCIKKSYIFFRVGMQNRDIYTRLLFC